MAFSSDKGTVTIAAETIPAGEKVTITWTSTSGGEADASGIPLNGYVERVVTNPGSAAPTANYDIVIQDADGADILAAKGANRHTSSTEQIVPFIGDGTGVDGLTSANAFSKVLTYGDHSMFIDNAGNAKGGTVVIYLSTPESE